MVADPQGREGRRRRIDRSILLAVALIGLNMVASIASESGVLVWLTEQPGTKEHRALDNGDRVGVVSPMTFFLGPARPATQDACCYPHSGTNLTEVFTEEFFAHQRTLDVDITHWTGNETSDWKNLSQSLFREDESSHEEHCRAEWIQSVLEESRGFYLRMYMDFLLEKGIGLAYGRSHRYVHDTPELPRVLFLGDSISRGIWVELYEAFRHNANASLHLAPANGKGFAEHEAHLDRWLGECTWDAIQFNVGMHYHPDVNATTEEIRHDYEAGLTGVVRRLRAHSPDAALVFALTTPSPMDSDQTFPDRATCPHYDKFHPAGFVAFLNDVAKSVLPALNVTINDRYGAVHPNLGLHQMPCDIHFHPGGYRALAEHDWGVVSELLATAN